MKWLSNFLLLPLSCSSHEGSLVVRQQSVSLVRLLLLTQWTFLAEMTTMSLKMAKPGGSHWEDFMKSHRIFLNSFQHFHVLLTSVFGCFCIPCQFILLLFERASGLASYINFFIYWPRNTFPHQVVNFISKLGRSTHGKDLRLCVIHPLRSFIQLFRLFQLKFALCIRGFILVSPNQDTH